MKEWKKLLFVFAAFLACFYLPIENLTFSNAIFEALALVKWYAREHVLLCLVPAFFIAGAISVFVSQAAVMRYFGAKANKFLSYSVASVSGTILAVCSCTVLPLFSGIYKRGAGLGPAIAFLYSGPAINVLAVILTARILGWQLGLARAIGAVIFSIVIGLAMHLIFIKEERARHASGGLQFGEVKAARPLWKDIIYFFSMVAILVFANWGKPLEGDNGIWSIIYAYKWWITGFFLAVLAYTLFNWFKKNELKEWCGAAWGFALQI
ncbi:MAG: permease, partial [Candidatus Omnitrophica bacterium]|nr:permease [Candidatus Omnitrophota bacterium]